MLMKNERLQDVELEEVTATNGLGRSVSKIFSVFSSSALTLCMRGRGSVPLLDRTGLARSVVKAGHAAWGCRPY
jgi:hypothetical protein